MVNREANIVLLVGTSAIIVVLAHIGTGIGLMARVLVV